MARSSGAGDCCLRRPSNSPSSVRSRRTCSSASSTDSPGRWSAAHNSSGLKGVSTSVPMKLPAKAQTDMKSCASAVLLSGSVPGGSGGGGPAGASAMAFSPAFLRRASSSLASISALASRSLAWPLAPLLSALACCLRAFSLSLSFSLSCALSRCASSLSSCFWLTFCFSFCTLAPSRSSRSSSVSLRPPLEPGSLARPRCCTTLMREGNAFPAGDT
mmetsp:Transcript_41670/g.100232  ORF Transcript_41670/g.100232 Transcript_41670/m.100232 type:complete len:217 (-) Transcript_41670:975-1625(-)